MPLPIPPAPAPAHVELLVAGGILLLAGAALLLTGRSIGRIILALAAAGAAAGCAPLIAGAIHFDQVLGVGILAAVAAGAVAFFLSRVLWALLLAGAVGLAAMLLVSYRAGAAPPDWVLSSPAVNFSSWVAGLLQYLLVWAAMLWQNHQLTVILWAAVPTAALLLGAMVYPQGGLILGSAAYGAASLIAGAASLLWALRPEWLPGWLGHAKIVGIVAAALALVGLILQSAMEIKLARAKAKARAEKEKQEQAKAQANAPPPVGKKK